MAGTEPRPSKRGPGGGFAALPLAALDALLYLPLSKRELLALLLVARLTHGCRGSAWARLKGVDLAAVGIGPGHAKDVLEGLLRRGLLEGDGSGACRLGNLDTLGDLDAATTEDGEARRTRLGALVARHLPKPSRNGNASTGVLWRFDRSQGRFLRETPNAIDKDR